MTDLQIGGTPTVVRELAIRLSAGADVHVEVACLSPWGPVADQLKGAGVCVTAFGARGLAHLPAVVARLVKLIGQNRIDTVFSFLLHANAVAAAASALCSDVRFIQSIQGSQPRPRWHWALHRFIHPAAELVVVPSRSSAEAAQVWSRIPAGKLVVIHNAVDVDEFAGVRPIPADRRPFPIGFLGRLDPLKRVGDLLEAAALLGDRVHLDIFGDGVERPAIERKVADLRLGEIVTMHGAIARPRDALERMGVLVLPSEAEGFGLVLIEADGRRRSDCGERCGRDQGRGSSRADGDCWCPSDPQTDWPPPSRV